MKNKLLKVSIFFPLIFMFTPNVNAECNDKELNDLAEKIEIKYSKYEVKKGEDDLGFAYVLTATPYNEKMSLKVKDTYTKDFYDVDYDKDYNGYALGSEVHHEEKQYIFRFYGKDTCQGELLREIKYKVPAYNLYALTSECEQEEYKDSDICKMNTDTKDITPEKFEKELKKIDEENKSTLSKIFEGILNNWYYAVIPVVLVAAVYFYKVHVFKKEQSKK